MAPALIVYAVSGDLLLNIRPIRMPLVAVLAILLFISLVIYFIHFRKEKKMSFIQVTKEEFNTHAQQVSERSYAN